MNFAGNNNSTAQQALDNTIEKTSLIGQRVKKPDAPDKATGKTRGELQEMANKSLEKLPPKRKEVYLLRKQEGLSVKEIAKKLDISPRTVESHLAKALGFLKKELESISLLTILFYYFYII